MKKITTLLLNITLLLYSQISVQYLKYKDNISGVNQKAEVICLDIRDTSTHDAGLLTLNIDDVGGAEGWRYTHIWPDTLNIDHLYWNWLAIGYSVTQVSDGWDGDWVTTSGGEMVITDTGSIADQEGYAQYHDITNAIEVTQESYAWADSPDDDYIIIKYTIKNIGSSTFSTLYAGHRSDFDVMGDHGGAPTDMSAFDSTRNLGYMWDDISSTWHVGVKLLEGDFRGYHQGWYSGSDSEKFYAISAVGADPQTPVPDDWCFWLSTGPYVIAPGDSVIVAFAFLAGEELSDLQINADAAQTKWDLLGIEETARHVMPNALRLQIYPNPFRQMTDIRYQIMDDGSQPAPPGGARPGMTDNSIQLKVYDASGRLVRQWNHTAIGQSNHISWYGDDDLGRPLPNGIYFCCFKTKELSITEEVILLK